jgi:hypothetical protein
MKVLINDDPAPEACYSKSFSTYPCRPAAPSNSPLLMIMIMM